MASRRDSAATDIARQNADVLLTVGVWLTRLLVPTALVCFTLTTAMGLHGHVVVTPSLWLHHLGAGDATSALRHLMVTLTIVLVGVTLESLVLCRDAFARGEPSAIAAVLATARRLFLGLRRAGLILVSFLSLRPTSRGDRNADDGILHQLCSALSVAPVGPPAHLARSSDLWGPFEQSGHRAEISAAA